MQILWPASFEDSASAAYAGLIIGWCSAVVSKHRAAVLTVLPCPAAACNATELLSFIKKKLAASKLLQAKSTDSRQLTILGMWKPHHSDSDVGLQLDNILDSLQLSPWLTMTSTSTNRPVLQSVRLADGTCTQYPSCYILYYNTEMTAADTSNTRELLNGLGSTLELIQGTQHLIPYIHGQQLEQQALKAPSSNGSESTTQDVRGRTQNRSLFVLHLCNRCSAALRFISKGEHNTSQYSVFALFVQIHETGF
jgi:hypothetical protein